METVNMADKLRVLAEKVAAYRKERALRRNPDMDEFAVRLNREPTWSEINQAMDWIRDLQACGAAVSASPAQETR